MLCTGTKKENGKERIYKVAGAGEAGEARGGGGGGGGAKYSPEPRGVDGGFAVGLGVQEGG